MLVYEEKTRQSMYAEDAKKPGSSCRQKTETITYDQATLISTSVTVDIYT